MKKAISVDAILSKSYNDIDLSPIWRASLGTPELSGVWIIWGHSSNGKTSFSLQLAKELCRFGKVAYLSLEEGTSKTMQMAIVRNGMHEVARKFVLLEDTIEELVKRLNRPKSPKIVFIDSYQFAGFTKTDYLKFKEQFKNKLIVFISHAEGKHPEGRSAKFVRYDADIKIWVEGYKAFPKSRYGGEAPYTIWQDGAQKYWSKTNENDNSDDTL